ncbi:Auxin F-box protein 5 isoform 2 [Theobroma cacao]|uniref:Auxin F-box protein 5 isoform 2 n=1 Tax=Theobroma cacao TaxID=3641 RepID=A0A061FE94_THECC|nr:Auxin F-box protein 5 isoform 2 [Theobroma cacao]
MRHNRAERMSEDDERQQSSPSDLEFTSNKARNCNATGSGSGHPEFQSPFPDQVLENVLENVLHFLTSRRDRNAASLVCKSWYRVEALTRSELFIGNCYAVSPDRATARFIRVRALHLKGKPRFADFNLMPPDWGAHFNPWALALAKAYPWLEKVYLKRMSVTDDDLATLAESFSGFKELVLVCCDGFGTSGLAIFVSKCSPLEVAGQGDQEPDYVTAFAACRSLVCLSGFREIIPDYLPAIYPVCSNLTSLNFSYANIDAEQLKPIISNCHKLQVFWVLDSICDEGLQAVAATCKELRELRVFPIDAREDSDGPVSEVGLQAISEGCRKLQSILYFCQRMTNAAVIAMSKNCPDLVVFRLCIMGRHRPDPVTGDPMDDGFGAIVMNCKKLTRLAVSGLLTDKAFDYIGRYGKLVRTLSVAFAGDSDMGLKYVLEGCPQLQKLEIRDSPFGDAALRSGLHHYYNMRFLWMSSCSLTRQGCQEIAHAMDRLVVEVIRSIGEEEMDDSVGTLYMYRSLEGPRTDAPKFVTIL